MNKEFFKAAFIRAIRTLCQTALALIGTATLMQDVNWAMIASASLMSAIVSFITSIATGLPEVQKNEEEDKSENNE